MKTILSSLPNDVVIIKVIKMNKNLSDFLCIFFSVDKIILKNKNLQTNQEQYSFEQEEKLKIRIIL